MTQSTEVQSWTTIDKLPHNKGRIIVVDLNGLSNKIRKDTIAVIRKHNQVANAELKGKLLTCQLASPTAPLEHVENVRDSIDSLIAKTMRPKTPRPSSLTRRHDAPSRPHRVTGLAKRLATAHGES